MQTIATLVSLAGLVAILLPNLAELRRGRP